MSQFNCHSMIIWIYEVVHYKVCCCKCKCWNWLQNKYKKKKNKCICTHICLAWVHVKIVKYMFTQYNDMRKHHGYEYISAKRWITDILGTCFGASLDSKKKNFKKKKPTGHEKHTQLHCNVLNRLERMCCTCRPDRTI